MNLSWLKWVVVLAVILFVLWLVGGSGTGYLQKRYTAATPGEDADIDARDESGLTSLGGFYLTTFRYDKAAEAIEAAIVDHPEWLMSRRTNKETSP